MDIKQDKEHVEVNDKTDEGKRFVISKKRTEYLSTKIFYA